MSFVSAQTVPLSIRFKISVRIDSFISLRILKEILFTLPQINRVALPGMLKSRMAAVDSQDLILSNSD
jgi:hypothetical protein